LLDQNILFLFYGANSSYLQALIWRTNKGVVINRSGIKRATKKTLVLDLDETLVHSRIHEPDHYNYAISLTFDDTPFTFYVSERPHVHTFLREVHPAPLSLTTCLVFTAVLFTGRTAI
jgi:hypothetical protein